MCYAEQQNISQYVKTNRQARNGLSGRHIYDSKMAKGLQSVKVFSTTAPKKLKSWTELVRQWGGFEIFHPFCRKSSKKLKGGPFGDFFCKSHNAEKI